MNRRKVEADYVGLLRASLWGGVAPEAPSEPVAVLQLADSQKTVPLIGDAFARCGCDPGGRAAHLLSSIMATTVYNRSMLEREIADICSMLDGHGIRAVLLKGQGLARWYPSADLRECGDIDLWVPEKDYARACELLLEFEQGLGEVSVSQKSEKHFRVQRRYVVVELHRRAEVLSSARRDAFYSAVELEGLMSGVVMQDFCGVQVATPADTFNAFYVFLHAWNHFTGFGVGLRQVCDWALLLHARGRELQVGVLQGWLEELGLMRAWQVFGALAVDCLGMPAGEMPFYSARYARRGRRLLRLILREGNFGKERSVRKNRPRRALERKARTVSALFGRMFRLLPVFPLLGFSLLLRGLGGGVRKLAEGR